MTGGKIGPEIAEMNSPRTDASFDCFTRFSDTIGGDSRNLTPIHPQLLFGGYSQVCCPIRDDVGNAMVEVQIEDYVFRRQTTLLHESFAGSSQDITVQQVRAMVTTSPAKGLH